jgi:16S rRNA (cytosine967-C5)-methyltransferase
MTALHKASQPPVLAPPLWRQLQACAQALQAVGEGRNHAQALSQVALPLRPATQALLFEVLRHWQTTLAVRDLLVKRMPAAPVNALLCTGLGLLLGSAAMYPAHTLVSQLVEAAKHHPQMRAQAAFLNACVRRFLREEKALKAQALQGLKGTARLKNLVSNCFASQSTGGASVFASEPTQDQPRQFTTAVG